VVHAQALDVLLQHEAEDRVDPVERFGSQGEAHAASHAVFPEPTQTFDRSVVCAELPPLAVVVHAVAVDADTRVDEPGGRKALGTRVVDQHAVRGESEAQAALAPVLEQVDQIGADERLTAGEQHCGHAERGQVVEEGERTEGPAERPGSFDPLSPAHLCHRKCAIRYWSGHGKGRTLSRCGSLRARP